MGARQPGARLRRWAWPTSRRASPTRARDSLAAHLQRPAGFGGRASARRADDDPARDGAAGGGRTEASAGEGPAAATAPTCCSGRWRSSGGGWTRRSRSPSASSRSTRPTRWRSPSSATRTCAQSKWDEAIAALQKSIWLNPFYSGPYILLGRAYMKKGQPATAEGMLRRAIQYDPNNRPRTTCSAQLLQQTGRDGGSETRVRDRRAAAALATEMRRMPASTAVSVGAARPRLCALYRVTLRLARSRPRPAGTWPVTFTDVAERGRARRIRRSTAASIASGSSSRPTAAGVGARRRRQRRLARRARAERHPA